MKYVGPPPGAPRALIRDQVQVCAKIVPQDEPERVHGGDPRIEVFPAFAGEKVSVQDGQILFEVRRLRVVEVGIGPGAMISLEDDEGRFRRAAQDSIDHAQDLLVEEFQLSPVADDVIPHGLFARAVEPVGIDHGEQVIGFHGLSVRAEDERRVGRHQVGEKEERALLEGRFLEDPEGVEDVPPVGFVRRPAVPGLEERSGGESSGEARSGIRTSTRRIRNNDPRFSCPRV